MSKKRQPIPVIQPRVVRVLTRVCAYGEDNNPELAIVEVDLDMIARRMALVAKAVLEDPDAAIEFKCSTAYYFEELDPDEFAAERLTPEQQARFESHEYVVVASDFAIATSDAEALRTDADRVHVSPDGFVIWTANDHYTDDRYETRTFKYDDLVLAYEEITSAGKVAP